MKILKMIPALIDCPTDLKSCRDNVQEELTINNDVNQLWRHNEVPVQATHNIWDSTYTPHINRCENINLKENQTSNDKSKNEQNAWVCTTVCLQRFCLLDPDTVISPRHLREGADSNR